MEDDYFYNADGELLFVPQQGRLNLFTELGIIEAEPHEIIVIPRGMKFKARFPDGPGRGYVLENYGAPFELPERGPVGSDGYANDRDFRSPVAAFEEGSAHATLYCKYGGRMFRTALKQSPLDVVAWVGTSVPCKYDTRAFNVMGSVSYDHPDPSVYTVLTSPSDTAGWANYDFVIFPPRWMVTEDTFRPPWYHRNVMSEYMGLIHGVYDAKTGGGFVPGGSSLHNCMSPHGPDRDAFEAATAAELKPVKMKDTMAFMFETRYPLQVTRWALESDTLQEDYIGCWNTLEPNFPND